MPPRLSIHAEPLNCTGPPVCAPQVSTHKTAIPQRGGKAFVSKEPPHLVEPRTATQPARRGEVTQRVRMKLPVRRQAGLRTQSVESLDEVTVLERSAHAIAEQKRLGRRRWVTLKPRFERPRRRGPDERNAILATLPTAHQNAAVRRPPVLYEQPRDFVGTQAAIGEHEEQRPIPHALQRLRADSEHSAQFVIRGQSRATRRRGILAETFSRSGDGSQQVAATRVPDKVKSAEGKLRAE